MSYILAIEEILINGKSTISHKKIICDHIPLNHMKGIKDGTHECKLLHLHIRETIKCSFTDDSYDYACLLGSNRGCWFCGTEKGQKVLIPSTSDKNIILIIKWPYSSSERGTAHNTIWKRLQEDNREIIDRLNASIH